MKIWTDASKKQICYVYEDAETIIAPVHGEMTTNQTEYLALVNALQDALWRGVSMVDVYTDSQVLAYQMTGRYKCKSPNLRPLRTECYRLLAQFDRWTINWIRRGDNKAGRILDRLGEGK